MANRGDVFRLPRRLGFGGEEAQHVVVLQATRLNAVLPTVLVAPIDQAVAMFDHNPLMIPVSSSESGLPHDGVIVLTALGSIPRDRLEAGRVGSLDAPTLGLAHHAMAILLGLVDVI